MSSNGQQSPRNITTPPQSIPMRDLARPPDSDGVGNEERGHGRGRSILSVASTASYDTRYERLENSSPSPPHDRNGEPSTRAPRPRLQAAFEDGRQEPHSPIDNPGDFQAAIGFAGLKWSGSGRLSPPLRASASTGRSMEPEPISPYGLRTTDSDGRQSYFEGTDSDRVPLTDPQYLQPVAGAGPPTTPRSSQDKMGFQRASFTPDPRSRSPWLGDDLPAAEAQSSRGRGSMFGASLSPDTRDRSRSLSVETQLHRAGSMMRAMSQRIVNLSNEAEPAGLGRAGRVSYTDDTDYPPIDVMAQDTAYHPDRKPSVAPPEKADPFTTNVQPPAEVWPENNPFRGKSLLIFPPDSRLRIWLCDFLVHPATEPMILVLIILQTILLTLESIPSVFEHPRPKFWGEQKLDWAMLVLFIIFTFEITARIIVSGLFFNAAEYSTIDRKRGLRGALVQKYETVFAPQRKASTKKSRDGDPAHAAYQPSIVRSFTTMNATIAAPKTAGDFRRAQLARRAFLRHSLTRLDFIAVVSFWLCFVLGVTGIENGSHVYVFRMLSCLRIMRLLALTNGTNIILKSLKKAAPMLVNVSFLIGFFWLIFAIIGVQAFKTSLGRQCTWIDPEGVQNFTNTADLTFCGGWLDNVTGAENPWLLPNGDNGSDTAKGYICPRGSLCILQDGPYNGTVSFNNIIQSLELVFVIMSANTFSDVMYYTTNSDYLASALFFAGGIVIMLLWLTNLLIAVITSSFQVIREESKGDSAFSRNVHHLSHPDQVPHRRNMAQRIVDKTAGFWILVIVLGLGTQAFRSSTMDQRREYILIWVETYVTYALVAEILMRFAVDWRHFHKKANNVVDLVLVIATGLMILPAVRNSGQVYAWLTVFQILRIYRVVWAVSITRELISKVLGNATGIGNLVLFVFLITYLVAILSCQLFRGDIPAQDSNGNDIEISFYSIWNAFLGMYQILSSENWTTILYNVTTYQNYLNVGWIGATFLIAWFILAFFILVNMFIAVIQENFDVSEDEKRLQQVKAFLQKKDWVTPSNNLALSSIFKLGRHGRTKDPLDYGQAAIEMLLKDAVVRDFLDEEIDPLQQNTDSIDPLAAAAQDELKRKSFFPRMAAKFRIRIWHREPNPFYTNLDYSVKSETLDARTMAREALTAKAQRKKLQRDFLARHPKYNKSLFIFEVDNPLRRLCQKIVSPGRLSERVQGVEPNKIVWYCFSAFIYACIVAMVVVACVTSPLYQRNFFADHKFTIKNWFVWTDLAFACIFSFEICIKVIADGLWFTPNAYFRSIWGFVDGLVMLTLWTTVAAAFLNEGTISRSIGAFKALRALRLLNVSDNARETFHSVIFVGGWRVISAAFVSISLLIPFAIWGVNLFSGKMVTCNDSLNPITNLTDCTGEWASTPFSGDWPLLAPRVAANPYYDFDNFGNALFILFQIVSQEGWVDVMWHAVSITGRGLQPQSLASEGNAIFFVIFNLMATVFILTLFISVFMRTYTEQTGVAFLTAEQRSWMELRKLLRHVNPSKRPASKSKTNPKWKIWCYRQATQKHGTWHTIITFILIFHLILLTMEFQLEPAAWEYIRNCIFLAFTIAYIANVTIRILGLSWARFRRSSWDIFSLLSVAGTFGTTIVLVTNIENPTYIRMHKLFLVSITLLLIPRNNALDQLFKTAAASLSKIGNLLATWFVLFLVWAIAMTQTFGLTRFGDNENNNVNFRSVPKALIVLFRMSVGEGWNQIMEDFASIQPPMCTEDVNFFNSDCGSASWARGLFISWNILSMYIFVSLFVSLIYESFSYVYQRSSGLAIVTREELRRFKQAWALFDPDGTGHITKEQFPRLLGELSGIFGMRIYDEEDSVRRILEDIQTTPPGSTLGLTAPSSSKDIDIRALNARLARINFAEVKERRQRYNMFYQEVIVSADPDLGISFHAVLMILAHYNVITDHKSLKLDEFLRRRARLQRVDEEARRRVVVGFFDTIYWSRKFKQRIDKHKTARMNEIPSYQVPEIIVDDEEAGPSNPFSSRGFTDVSRSLRTPEEQDGGSAGNRTSYFTSGHDQGTQESPRHRRGTNASYGSSAHSSPSRSPNLAPTRTTYSQNSAYSFEPDRPEMAPAAQGRLSINNGAQRGRGGSTASGANIPGPSQGGNVLDAFGSSAWGESLRRNYTQKQNADHQER